MFGAGKFKYGETAGGFQTRPYIGRTNPYLELIFRSDNGLVGEVIGVKVCLGGDGKGDLLGEGEVNSAFNAKK
jgi:hypothetical protein